MNPLKVLSSLSLAAVTSLPLVTIAQSDFYYRRPQIKEDKSRISFSAQVLSGIDVELRNLGTLHYPGGNSGEFPLQFNDGYVQPVAGSDLTSDLGFLMENARVNADGYVESFDLTRYRSESLGAGFKEEISSGYGWEVVYDYQWGSRKDRFRLGVRAGMSLNRLQFDADTTVEGKYLMQTATFHFSEPSISHSSAPGAFYIGNPAGGPAVNPHVDLVETEVVERVWDGDDVVVPSRVRNQFKLDGLAFNARLGPTLAVRLLNRFDFEVSAGAVGVYYDADISMRKTLLNLPFSGNLAGGPSAAWEEHGSDSEFLYGFYGEGLLRFHASERTSFYLSAVYMSLNNPESTALPETEYEVSFDSPMMLALGVSLRF